MRGDFDGDGKLSIVDAFKLAKAVKEESKNIKDWDINKDGQVDLLDSQRLAKRAVSLKEIR